MFDLSFFMVLMSLSMLTKAPKEYICESTAHDGSYSCQPEDFCNDPSVFSVKPNLELADSYDNWIISFNLQCASKADIGLIGSSFFIGWVTLIPLVSPLADKFGRWKLLFAGTVMGMIAWTILLNSSSFAMLIFCMAIHGGTSNMRIAIAMLNTYESMTRAHYVAAFVSTAVFEASCGPLSTLYFMFVSK
mmetsp:Transcript_27305/g.36540  ORF Transcript_27305/g.36540 Transcript_27305/m.36540 type:complete len:190 (+) Transcript_27305:152-721(+)|eukprot:CAMPEP_0185570636 /NCGR_PEP_ID=MMETSP0434-20130131/2880_1 /TAXON_ID=626734 ORGANISM="Favella taraikaensis, Strain Fe Narragansett Bay" /NCGR_SAMPLE_ID=MMETSP0434 /ASSEMBLY_ACC=CAM_ASM_000379 /LENGTH=189 /DNA_ID=CAMNT_0028185815 /DNA_START=75 /DNA_END=644 /DNA_ORIENTATION=-